MTCPYAERRGFIVYCKLTKRFVNPLTRPCISGDYTRCPEYQKALSTKGEQAKPVEEQRVTLTFNDEVSARLTDPIYLAVLIARSRYVDAAYGKPVDLLAWGVKKAGEAKVDTARIDLACPEEGWSAILVLRNGVYIGAVAETREGEKLAGRSAWNMIKGSDCKRAAAVLYQVEQL